MAAKIAARMERMAPSGIRKVNEKGQGKRSSTLRSDGPTSILRSTSKRRLTRHWLRARSTTPPTSV